MLSLAREIKAQTHLTVVTAAVNVATILSKDSNIDVVQLEGYLEIAQYPWLDLLLKE